MAQINQPVSIFEVCTAFCAYNSRVTGKVLKGQLKEIETRERKGMPKTEVNILDWAAHHNSHVAQAHESLATLD